MHFNLMQTNKSVISCVFCGYFDDVFTFFCSDDHNFRAGEGEMDCCSFCGTRYCWMIGGSELQNEKFPNLRSGKNSSPGHVPRAQPNIAPSNVWMWVLSFSEMSFLIFLYLGNLSQSCRQTKRNIEKYVLQAKLHQRKHLPQSKMKLLSKCIFTCLVCRTFYNTSNPPPATVKEKAEKERKIVVSVIAF